MKPLALLAFLSLMAQSARAARLTVIGDSLTKEYAITFPGLVAPPFVNIPGIDPLNPSARNWAEILDEQRHAHFDSGLLRGSLFDRWSDLRLLGHEHNWAVPGATSRTIALVLTNPNSTELTSDPDFTTITNFAADWRLSGPRMIAQVQTEAAAAVIWCGGNDLRYGSTDPAARVGGTPITYGTIHAGNGTGLGDPLPLMNSIRDNIRTAALHIRSNAPTRPIAVCAVPHIGCSPIVKSLFPTDPVRTGRITAALDALNAELRTWSETTLGGIWIDVYAPTKALIDGTLTIGGVPFLNASDTVTSPTPASAHNVFLFSRDGFHPNTPIQAWVAQQVQASLTARYPAIYGNSEPLTDRDLITTVLGLSPSRGFDLFVENAGVPAGQRGPFDDPDGDRLANLMEFALGGHDPMSAAATAGLVPGSLPGTATLTWRPRFASNIYARLVCQQSTDLAVWTEVPDAALATAPDGSVTATVPVPPGGARFLRLRAIPQP